MGTPFVSIPMVGFNQFRFKQRQFGLDIKGLLKDKPGSKVGINQDIQG